MKETRKISVKIPNVSQIVRNSGSGSRTLPWARSAEPVIFVSTRRGAEPFKMSETRRGAEPFKMSATSCLNLEMSPKESGKFIAVLGQVDLQWRINKRFLFRYVKCLFNDAVNCYVCTAAAIDKRAWSIHEMILIGEDRSTRWQSCPIVTFLFHRKSHML